MSDYTLISKNKTLFGRGQGKRDMVFCIIYCDEAKPYKDYDYFINNRDPEVQKKVDLNVPLVLAQMRFDGKLGFVGGNVEKHHSSLLEALHDELEEEIGVSMSLDELEQKVEPLATFENKKGTIYISSYLWKVDYKTILELQQNARNGKHFISENCGNVLLQIHEKSITSLSNQVFSGSGRLELQFLIEEKKLLDKVTISNVNSFLI